MRLFVERAKAVDETFSLDEENAAAVAEITRYLGGVRWRWSWRPPASTSRGSAS